MYVFNPYCVLFKSFRNSIMNKDFQCAMDFCFPFWGRYIVGLFVWRLSIRINRWKHILGLYVCYKPWRLCVWRKVLQMVKFDVLLQYRFMILFLDIAKQSRAYENDKNKIKKKVFFIISLSLYRLVGIA